MSGDIWFIGDTHFGHTNIVKFLRDDGSKLRPWEDCHEMNEALVQNWNSVVKQQDKVFHLGDVALGKNLNIMARLNGSKRLIKGNHDKYKLKEYAQYFHDIYGVRHLPGLVLSHVPLHPSTLARWGVNIHGHLHYNPSPAGPYFNVSVECINYTPIHIDEIAKITGRKLL